MKNKFKYKNNTTDSINWYI